MRTEARFPAVADQVGHYESFFIKAARPGGGQGVWIRHTVHKRPGGEPRGALWLTFFDAAAGSPRATKVTLGPGLATAPPGGYIRLGDSVLEPGRARGGLRTDDLDAAWDLSFATELEPFCHLPREWMYSGRLPRTKVLSPYPGARFEGTLDVGGERIEVDGWPGTVGHNWGAEHAERWVWIHAGDLRGGEGHLDIAAGRIRVGGGTSPWTANGMLRLDGEDLRLGGIGHIASTRIDERPTRCDFSIGGRGVRVRGRVSAAPQSFVGWLYADPDGSEHNVVNCSIADLELNVERRGMAPRRIESVAAAAYELGMRESDHGIPIQPFADG